MPTNALSMWLPAPKSRLARLGTGRQLSLMAVIRHVDGRPTLPGSEWFDQIAVGQYSHGPFDEGVVRIGGDENKRTTMA